jgi:uncharacterized protein
MRLGQVEGRVVGSLIEKQLTTPAQYPLTLNALLLACNQSSNRDPVVSYDERTLDAALVSLKEAGLVRFVHPSHGRSVIRYRQVLHEKLGLDDPRLALVGVLLLRGPQTAGELRARTERMARFDGIAAVDADLEALSRGPDPLVLRLPRRPGQKEERWVQLLSGPATTATQPGLEPELEPADYEPSGYERSDHERAEGHAGIDALHAAPAPASPPPPSPAPASPAPPSAAPSVARPTQTLSPAPAAISPAVGPGGDGTAQLAGELAALRAELGNVRAEMATLRHDLDELREAWADS